MVTYIYWAFILSLMLTAVVVAGVKRNNLVLGLVGALVILAVGWAAYYFHFEQVFVKRWGGVMTITVPAIALARSQHQSFTSVLVPIRNCVRAGSGRPSNKSAKISLNLGTITAIRNAMMATATHMTTKG